MTITYKRIPKMGWCKVVVSLLPILDFDRARKLPDDTFESIIMLETRGWIKHRSTGEKINQSEYQWIFISKNVKFRRKKT